MNEISNQRVSEDEIDLVELLKKIYLKKKFILKTSILAALFGVVYALFQPIVFTTSTTFIPQLSSGVKTGGSSLSGLASLAGINISNLESSPEFPPTLYPQVVNGIPFKLDLLSYKIIHNDKEIFVKDYFSLESKSNSFNFFGIIKKYTVGLPSLILGSSSKTKQESKLKLNKSGIHEITENDKILFQKLSQKLSLSINKDEGFITISFKDGDKHIAAQITQIAQNLLQEKIIDFKNQSSREILSFAMLQFTQKKESYEKLQDELAIFNDKNINISSSLFQNKLSRIEREVNTSELIVQQLASQVEQAKLQVNKDTPVFTTINPVSLPYSRSAPNRSQIVIISLLLGIVFSCSYVLVKEPISTILKSIKS
jgi:capsular polysaccharide biosynthesis protein